MVEEVLHIAELTPRWIPFMYIRLIISNLPEFLIVSIEEWIDSLNSWIGEELGHVHHHKVIILFFVEREDVV